MSIEDPNAKETIGGRSFAFAYLAATCVATIGWFYAIGRGLIGLANWMLS